MKLTLLTASLLLSCSALHAVDYKTQIEPLLKEHCYKCHSEAEKKEKGKLVLDNLERLGKKVGPDGIIIPGNAEKSSFFTCLVSPEDEDGHMPPEKMMPEAQIDLIKQWIAGGASFVAGAAPAPAPAAAAGGMKAWKSADGRAIQAEFIKLEGTNVVLKRSDGQTFTVALDKLAPESQAMAKNGGK